MSKRQQPDVLARRGEHSPLAAVSASSGTKRNSSRSRRSRGQRLCRLPLLALTVLAASASADPISTTPRFFFAGNVDFALTGGTLRTASNATNSCAVGNTSSASLTSIPVGATVRAAFLYWAGSGASADNTVTFQGATVTASRTFSDTFFFGGLRFDFFSGFADVTSLVSGNGSYSFADLTVTNTDQGTNSPYCSRAAVLSGWGLVVVYDSATEPLRAINLFDGFQHFRGNQIQVSPSNFLVPASPVDGKVAILTWEGDVENSTPAGGVSENLTFDGASTPPQNLTDALNPINNQFNSTINSLGNSTSYGVDVDSYDISSLLRPNDSSAVTTYSSGGDLVLLSLQVVSTTNTDAADLSLSKRLVDSSFSNAAPATFGLSVSNAGPSPDTGPITVTDSLPSGLSFLSAASSDGLWSCSGSTTVTCTHPGPLAVAGTLPELLLTTGVDPSITVPIVNQATVSSPIFDGNGGNDSASLTISAVLSPDLSSSRKEAQDLNDGDLVAGDTVRYRIVLEETAGAAVSDLRFEDTLDPLLTNPTFVNLAGGTDASSGSALVVTGIDVPAGGTVTLAFDAVVAATAVDGDRINNTANITKAANGIDESLSAPELIVGTQVIPTSGIKPLYFQDIAGTTNSPSLPLAMSRTPLGVNSNPERVRIRRNDDNRDWELTPALAAPLTLGTDPIPVRLYLRRNGNTTARVIRTTLRYGPGNTFLGCAQRTLITSGSSGLSSSVTRAFDFNIEQTDANCNPIAAAPVIVPAGSTLTLNVDNSPAGGGGQAIFVYPFSTADGEGSGLELPALTIINVDNLAFYDAPGAGTLVTEAMPGDVVYLRAAVSDPFGAFDITAASFEVSDSTTTLVASGPMVEISATAATRTFEVPFTVPAAAENGLWQATVTAEEGTEGTISHSASSALTITGGAGLRIEKTLTVISDGGNGTPKAIPGAEVEYVIRVENTGSAPIEADSIIIDDLLPPELRLVLGPAAPVTLADGSPGSGLTLTFGGLGDGADDIQFSRNGGASFFTPSADSNGLDSSVPPVNFLRMNPKGTMPGNGGVAPSFELRLRMRIP